MSGDHVTTFEEAKQCPKCSKVGEEAGSKPGRNSRNQIVTVHFIKCKNPICPWFDTKWVVQVNPDGTIPKAYEQLGDKQFIKPSQETVTKIEENILSQIEVETQRDGHGEIRNPRG